MPRYRIFVVFHDTLKPEYYHESVLDHFVFVNVNPHNSHVYPGLKVVNLFDFEHFIPLGKWYTESEVIYNVFKHRHLYTNVDFVGFLQYDVDASPLRHDTLQQLLEQAQYVSFEPHWFNDDYAQRILMDPAQPNTLRGAGKNCYEGIFEDFNRHYHTAYVLPDWLDQRIGLCSCFLTKKQHFEELMAFVEEIIQSKKLDNFDTRHQYRIQGGLLERYYAVWFLLRQIPLTALRLEHDYAETKRQNTLMRRLTDRLRGLLKR